ncbi:MAG: phospholipid scramblase-related protein [Gemmataceae bacterium]
MLGRAEESIGRLQAIRTMVHQQEADVHDVNVEICRRPSRILALRAGQLLPRPRFRCWMPKEQMIGYFKSKIAEPWRRLLGLRHPRSTSCRNQRQLGGMEFPIPHARRELGIVTKKWAGLAKEMFTSADNYIVSIHDDLSDQTTLKRLLLAAALAIDVVYKEGSN